MEYDDSPQDPGPDDCQGVGDRVGDDPNERVLLLSIEVDNDDALFLENQLLKGVIRGVNGTGGGGGGGLRGVSTARNGHHHAGGRE